MNVVESLYAKAREIPDAPALLASDEPGSVGKAVPGVGVEVIDDDGVAVPSGTAGRLRVRSNGMCDGYLDDPGETARSFRDGWFVTGDRVELTPRGTLIHHGRADELIIYDGVNIYPAEIENVLMKHPAVTDPRISQERRRQGTPPRACDDDTPSISREREAALVKVVIHRTRTAVRGISAPGTTTVIDTW